ncbi:Conserved TM helix [Micromonospora sediminicola]|uniref:Conserved TM helix n=1 Tax=Micromonospora sediminicola TaxID=946078 RepID=A0A1A9BAJ8_9ACTN|nr:Conserved TM helix [Micromonospora sediminicola]
MRDNFGDAVGDAFRSVMLFLPKAVAFVAILVVGWLIAKAVLKLVDKVLERVHFDRAVERGGIKTALARSKYDASDIVAKLAYYGVLLVTLQLAFGIWGPNPISDLIAGVVAWLPRAFVAIVIVVVAAAIARAVKDIISSALGGLSYGRVLANLASVFILGLGVIAALNQIGVATAVTTPVLIAVLATVGGILVVGVGGGLVRPMQSRWETWLTRAEEESRTIATHARAYQAGRRDVAARMATSDPYGEAELTQPVARDAEADRTQPVSAYAGSEPTQPVPARTGAEASPAASTDVTQAIPSFSDSERTQPTAPRQPTAEQAADSEATMVIPPADVDKFRR